MRQTAYWFSIVLLLALGALSLLPLVEWNSWWIRLFDFARLHYLAVLVIAMTVLLLVWSGRPLAWTAMLVGLAAIGFNVWKLAPYLPPRGELATGVAECPEGSRLRVLVANVHRGLEDADELFRVVRETEPDLFLAVETDEWWDERLAELGPRFAAEVQQVAGARSYFGMHLFSQFPLEDTEVLFPLDNRVPAIRADVALPDGATVSFHGLHPRPPTPFQDSIMRDAQLMLTALDARGSETPVVVAGDFNAVPWERTFRRTMRIGGLLDPRVGRGYMATYDARMPLYYWPLDHVLFTEEFGVTDFEIPPGFGSDHWPVVADLCHRPELAEQQSAPALQDGDLEEARTTLETAGVIEQAGTRSGNAEPPADDDS